MVIKECVRSIRISYIYCFHYSSLCQKMFYDRVFASKTLCCFQGTGRLFQILGSKYCIFVCGLFLAKVDLV